ncbi:MAG: signal recognition particle-docking protein FtsY [Planctomycetes bacterium]|nr:signal recognition particle-docking protein FtsY [Planctomycetota bacterium]
MLSAAEDFLTTEYIAATATVLILAVLLLVMVLRRKKTEEETAPELPQRPQRPRQQIEDRKPEPPTPVKPAQVQAPTPAPARPISVKAPPVSEPSKPISVKAPPVAEPARPISVKAPPVAEPAGPISVKAPPVEAPKPEPQPVTPPPAPIKVEAQPVAPEPEPEPTPVPEPEPEKKGFFQRLTRAISKTSMVFRRRVMGLVGLGQKIDEETLEKLEEAMLEADLGVATTEHLMETLREAWKGAQIETTDQILPFIRKDLKERLTRRGNTVNYAAAGPTVILVVGVNGVGKTTSIAKLARHFVRENKKVVLAAADTFRAAAVKQLQTWSDRIGCEVVAGVDRADPASVAFKGAERALEVGADVLLVDTAGRLHTQKNLMDELTKITKVLDKKITGAPHETILVLDATTGQNAVTQAEMFKAAANVSGLFLAKLDGTAKGGAVLTINEKVAVPVKFVGLGESFDDIQGFSAENFVDALFNLDSN